MRLLPDLWTGFRTGPARAALAFASLALGLFAATVLLAALDALRLQARTLVQSFGADVFVLTPAPESAWNRHEVEYFRRNLGADAWVSGVKILAPVPGVDFTVVAGDESPDPQAAVQSPAPAEAVAPASAQSSKPTPLAGLVGDKAPSEGSGAVLVGYGTSASTVSRRPRKGGTVARGERVEEVNESYATDQPVSRPVGEVTAPGTLGGEPVPPPLPEPGEPAPTASEPSGKRAKPQVRRLARDLGVDLDAVGGTGPEGAVTAVDVARAASGGQAPGGTVRRVPLRGVRREMVASMMESVKVPQASLWADVDVSETVRLIDALKKRREFDGLRISPILILARAVCLAMGRSPEVNGSIDVERSEIIVPSDVNLGIATATARGLVVPNIKGANTLSLVALASALNGIVTAAREGRITPADCRGGTFTITNVGVFGIEGGTPILVPGEAAVLCLGTIGKRPCVVKGPEGTDTIEIRSMATLTLTIDHRVLDGESGARFLNDVATVLREPALSLLF